MAGLRAGIHDVVIEAGQLRMACCCAPGPAQCPVCADLRARAGRLEAFAGLAGTLARG